MSGTFSDPYGGQDNGFFSRLINGLNTPQVQGMLLGLTAGAGQAAMPSRMPIPTGAALGMAASGILQGQKDAYTSQYIKQHALQEQLGNIGTASGLPVTLARNKMLQQFYSDPNMLQNLLQGSMSGAPMGVPATAQTPPTLSMSPSVSTSAQTAANVPGAFPSASSRATPPSGGFNGWATGLAKAANNPLNMRFAGQPGAVNTNGFAAFATPEMGVAATNQLFDKYADSGINTLNGLISRWAPPSENDTNGYINTVSKATGLAPDARIDLKDPAIRSNVQRAMAVVEGNKNASQPGGATPAPSQGINASNALETAQQYEQQANKLELMKSLGLPIPGDPAALRAAAQQYRTLGLVAPTAEAKAQVELGTAGAIQGAKSRAESAEKPFNDRYGNIYIGDGKGGFKYLGRGSEVRPVWNNATGQMEYGDVGGLGVGSTAGMPGAAGAAPASGAGGIGQASAPPPTQLHFMEQRGKDLAEQYQKIDTDAASAKEGNYLFDNLRNDSQTWQMGKFADWENEGRAWLSAVAHQFNVPFEGDKPLADYQAFLKSSGSLLRTAVHDTSSRAAVQEYNLIGQTLPQPTTSTQAFGQIADQWQGANDFRLAKQKMAAGYQGHPQDFNVDFNSNVSPTSFMLNRMSQSPQGQIDMHDMLARMQTTAEGRIAARHMLSQYRFAKQHGLFEDLTPVGASAEVVPAGGQ